MRRPHLARPLRRALPQRACAASKDSSGQSLRPAALQFLLRFNGGLQFIQARQVKFFVIQLQRLYIEQGNRLNALFGGQQIEHLVFNSGFVVIPDGGPQPLLPALPGSPTLTLRQHSYAGRRACRSAGHLTRRGPPAARWEFPADFGRRHRVHHIQEEFVGGQ